MKLLIISALIAVSAAARLEHLEQANGRSTFGDPINQYIPPFGSSGNQSPDGHGPHGQGGHGPNGHGANGHGSNVHGSFGQNNFGSNAASNRFGDATSNKYLPPFSGNSNSLTGFGSERPGAGPFNAATSNKYLPPNHSSTFGSQNAGSQFGQNAGSQFPGPQGSFGQPGFNSQYNQPGFPNRFGSASNSQFGAGQTGFGQRGQSQYRPGQDIPQQSFDEETGYHY